MTKVPLNIRGTWRVASILPVAFLFGAGGIAPDRADGPTNPLHIELESSVPADGDTVRSPIDGVVLTFSGPVEARLSSVRWIGASGDTVSLRVAGNADQPEVVTAAAPPGENGSQRLLWRTVSADGHQASGRIAFVVAATEFVSPAGGEVAATPDPVEQEAPAREAATDAGELASSRLVARGLGMFFLLGFAGLLWFGLGTRILDESRSHRLASILGMGATALLTVDLLIWLNGLRIPGTGLAETFAVAVDTRTGAAETWRMGLAGLAFLAFTGLNQVRVGAFLAMGAVVVGALGGHQAAIEPLVSLPVNALHMGAAAVWTGGLLLVMIWPADPGGVAPEVGWSFPRVVRRVSSAALLAVGVILVTAIVQDLLYLPSLAAVFDSGYGRLILVKSAGFTALVALGAYNRLRLIPRLEGDGGGSRTLRNSVRVELIVVIVTVLVAVTLAQLPPPVE